MFYRLITTKSKRLQRALWVFLLLISSAAAAQQQQQQQQPDLVDLKQLIPQLKVDIRYYGSNNFIGSPIAGYLQPKALLSRAAAAKIADIAYELAEDGLGLYIFDAYRPQRAVDHFVRWAEDLGDTIQQKTFYPGILKSSLFEKGYIAKKSGHSRGSTIDLTLYELHSGEQLDMGGIFDFFGPLSSHQYSLLSAAQKKHRKMLRTIMDKHGFKAYEQEWWHYTLREEPYPNQYFDVPVQ